MDMLISLIKEARIDPEKPIKVLDIGSKWDKVVHMLHTLGLKDIQLYAVKPDLMPSDHVMISK